MGKGKLIQRSAADLPHEIIRLVADNVIQQQQIWTPHTWTNNGRAPGHRKVWNLLMSYQTMNNLQNVCRQWEAALNTSQFWWEGLKLLDPSEKHDIYARNLNSREQLPPGVMFRHVFNSSCIPCRINAFYDPVCGIATSSHQEQTPHAGFIGSCDFHAQAWFCFSCLHDGVARGRTLDGSIFIQGTRIQAVGLQKNWDDKHFEHCKILCSMCRMHKLQETITSELGTGALEHAKTGLITRRIMHDFTWTGASEVERVINTITAQFWITDNTDHELEFQDILNRERTRRLTPLGVLTNEAENEAVRAVTGSVKLVYRLRESALSKWATGRIMDGLWISPKDVYQDREGYARLAQRITDANEMSMFLVHPTLDDVGQVFNIDLRLDIPAGEFRTEVQTMYDNMFRSVMMPALRNCLARLIAVAEVQGKDVIALIRKTDVETLFSAEFLFAAEIWSYEYDWERHLAYYAPSSPTSSSSDSSVDHPVESRPVTSASSEGGEDESRNISSSRSAQNQGAGSVTGSSTRSTRSTVSGGDDGSERTSPSTTLQTTPSPEPLLAASPELRGKDIGVGSDARDCDTPTASHSTDTVRTPMPPPSSASSPTSPVLTEASEQAFQHDNQDQHLPALSSNHPAKIVIPRPSSPPPVNAFKMIPYIPIAPSLIGSDVRNHITALWAEVVDPMYKNCQCSMCHRRTLEQKAREGRDDALIGKLLDSVEGTEYRWGTRRKIVNGVKVKRRVRARARGRGRYMSSDEEEDEEDVFDEEYDDDEAWDDDAEEDYEELEGYDELDEDEDEDEEEEEDDVGAESVIALGPQTRAPVELTYENVVRQITNHQIPRPITLPAGVNMAAYQQQQAIRAHSQQQQQILFDPRLAAAAVVVPSQGPRDTDGSIRLGSHTISAARVETASGEGDLEGSEEEEEDVKVHPVNRLPKTTVPSSIGAVPSTPPHHSTKPFPHSPAHTSHVYARGRAPGSQSAPEVPAALAGTRRSRSTSAESDDEGDDEDASTAANDESSKPSKRRRSDSPTELIASSVDLSNSNSVLSAAERRRGRANEDVGGPDGEIVLDEGELRHGRKRVRSLSHGDEPDDGGDISDKVAEALTASATDSPYA